MVSGDLSEGGGEVDNILEKSCAELMTSLENLIPRTISSHR